MFILFYHSMNAEQSFDNLPFSGVNQEKPHNQNFKITILWGGINKKKTVYLHYIIIQKRNTNFSAYQLCLFIEFRRRFHCAFHEYRNCMNTVHTMIFYDTKNSLNIVHGFMNATFIYEGYEHRS